MEEVGVSCPISERIVNENIVRLIAFFVVATSCIALLTHSIVPVVILFVDFGLRAFLLDRFSPFKWLALKFGGLINIGFKPTNHAPKLFAARVGFTAVLVWLIIGLFGLTVPFWIVGSVMVGFATLESGFAICVGCIMYQQLTTFGLIKVSA